MSTKKVLVVDDDLSIAPLISTILKKNGGKSEFEVISAADGMEAIARLEQESNNIDEVLLDYGLPGIDGIQVLAQIMARTSEIPVVMLTSSDDQKIAVQAAREGASDFIRKPFDHDFLTMVVQRVIDEKEQKKELREIRIEKDKTEAAKKAKEEFLSNMSHEIRNPLAAIIPFFEQIVAKIDQNNHEKAKKFAERGKESAQQLLELINDLLDLAKINQGKVELRMEKVSIRTVISRLESQFELLARKQGVDLAIEIPDNLPAVLADRTKISRVIANLVSNATKFTDKGGTVKIRAMLDGENLKVAVEDTGIGIAEKDMEMIFEEFKQVYRTAEREQNGSGLGLPICKKLIELHSGKIWVESIEGKGSTFLFTLPV